MKKKYVDKKRDNKDESNKECEYSIEDSHINIEYTNTKISNRRSLYPDIETTCEKVNKKSTEKNKTSLFTI